jgi:hypothetical protein
MAATSKPANVRQKLAQARLQFLRKGIKKSGKNMKLEYMYFELQDIIPSAIEIFAELGLVSDVDISTETATMTIYNADDLEEPGITYSIPYCEAGQIHTKDGREVTTPIQALGSSITYLRRYLWMMALDIVEYDSIDNTVAADPDPAPPKKPATVEERKEAKKVLTSKPETPAKEPDLATPEQMQELKAACKKLIEADRTKFEKLVQGVALKTKGLTEAKLDGYNKLMKKISDTLAEYSK